MAAASRPMAPYARKEEGGREGGKGGCGGGDSYARIEGKEGLSFPLLCSMLLRWANREVGERTIRWLYHSERVVTREEIHSSRQKKL